MKQLAIHSSLWALVMIATAVPRSAMAAEPVNVSEVPEEYSLRPHIEYIEDKDGTLTWEDVLKPEGESRFLPYGIERTFSGFTDSVFWFSVAVQNPGTQSIDRLFEIAYTLLDDVDIHLIPQVGEPSHFHMGDSLVFSKRPIQHRNFVIPLKIKESGLLRILIRVDTLSPLWTPMNLWSPQAFIEKDTTLIAVQGVYFGFIVAMAIYNLFVFFSIRERAYLYYVGFVLGVAGWQAAINGLSFQYLWPDSVFWAERNLFSLSNMAGTAACLFAQEFLGLRDHAKKHFFVLSIMAWASALTVLLSFSLSYSFLTYTSNVLIIVGVPAMLSAGVVRWRQGNIEARYYTVAFMSLLVGVFIFSLSALNFFGANALTIHGPQLGSAIQMVLLSLGLARKLKILTDDNLQIQQEAAESLQQKVDERTLDLTMKTLEAEEATQEALIAKSEAEGLRMEAEEHAEELHELDKQKTAFFQNISHELRTPLTLILNPLEEASKDYAEDKNIEVAAKNSRRLLRLVNQLLDFQKLEAGKQKLTLTPVDLTRFTYICSDYFASACSNKDVEFFTTVNGEPVQEKAEAFYVLGEVDALEKVTFNFLSNALKYTPGDGQIELALTTTSDKARISVRDTGPGISEEGKKKLFQVFSQVDETTTRQYEGTGLGLALVKSLAEEMNGEVGIDSEVGSGSTFWVEFPLVDAPGSVVDVLLVEDDKLTLLSLAEILEGRGSITTCMLAENALEARKILKHHNVKCIISDETMPGESGVELLSFVAESQPESKRVLVTGQVGEELLSKAINSAHVDHVFTKPISVSEFREVIEDFVRTSPISGHSFEEGDDFEVKEWLLADGEGQTGLEDTGVMNTLVEFSEGSGEIVLVVDDLPDMRELIGNSLKKKKYRVATAPNGKRGVEIARQIKPNIIITDWMMPLMSGPDLIKAIREDDELKGTPIILLTAKSDEESKLIGKGIGADAFLGKPFNDVELGSTVQNLVRLKTGEKEIEKLNRFLTESVLKRYLPPALIDQIVKGNISMDRPAEMRRVTVLFSDLCGFTSTSETLGPQAISELLNEYLTTMNDIIFQHGGTIDKFIGDAIMVIFGAPLEMESKEQAERSIACAKDMQVAMGLIASAWKFRGAGHLTMRVGIHQGDAVVGNFGSDRRSDYTCIGPTVNMASRIESVCESGHVFVSGELCKFLPDGIAEKAGDFELKGVAGDQCLYRLVT